jgi:hypothetical protein
MNVYVGEVAGRAPTLPVWEGMCGALARGDFEVRHLPPAQLFSLPFFLSFAYFYSPNHANIHVYTKTNTCTHTHTHIHTHAHTYIHTYTHTHTHTHIHTHTHTHTRIYTHAHAYVPKLMSIGLPNPCQMCLAKDQLNEVRLNQEVCSCLSVCLRMYA